jgi:hypothetical protein
MGDLDLKGQSGAVFEYGIIGWMGVIVMKNVNLKFWNSASREFVVSSEYLIDCDGDVFCRDGSYIYPSSSIIPVESTGVTDNEGGIIYYGDTYHIYGYGVLAVKELHDLILLVESKCEGNLGDKLGSIYGNIKSTNAKEKSLSGGALDTLYKLIEIGHLKDGDLPSKSGMSDLIRLGLAFKDYDSVIPNGITKLGISYFLKNFGKQCQ